MNLRLFEGVEWYVTIGKVTRKTEPNNNGKTKKGEEECIGSIRLC